MTFITLILVVSGLLGLLGMSGVGAGAGGTGGQGGSEGGASGPPDPSKLNEDPAIQAALGRGSSQEDAGGGPGTSAAGGGGAPMVKLSDGREVALTELESAFTSVSGVTEKEKGAQAKFEAAARQMEAVREYQQVAEIFASGGPQRLAAMQHLLGKLSGEERTQLAAVMGSAGGSGSGVGGEGGLPKIVKFESETERTLYGALQQAFAKIEQLGGQVQALGGLVPEFRSFVQSSSQASQAQQWKAALKAEYGFEASDADIAQMRESGISDPVKAFAWFKPKLEGAFAKGTQGKGSGAAGGGGAGEIPKAEGKTFNAMDPNLRPGDVERLLSKGFLPVDSSGRPMKVPD